MYLGAQHLTPHLSIYMSTCEGWSPAAWYARTPAGGATSHSRTASAAAYTTAAATTAGTNNRNHLSYADYLAAVSV